MHSNKGKMRKIHYVVFLCVLALAGCGRRNVSETERVISVGVIQIGESEKTFSKSYDGNIKAARHQLILAPHSGYISSLNAKVGQYVRKDRVFAHIEAPDVQSLNDANKATLRQARDGYERAKKVYEAGGLTEIAWMDIQTKLAQAEASAAISDRSLDKCDVKAPFNGTVSEIFVATGQNVSMGERIAEIIDEGELNVTIDVPENEYQLVKDGTPATVVVPALGGEKIYGNLNTLAVNSHALTHSYTAEIVLNKKPAALKPGMICKVYLEHSLEDRLEIPGSVVKVDEGGNYVWLVDENGIVQKRYVKTGSFIGKGVAVKSGLSNGDLVIVEGMSKVSTGMKAKANIIESR